MYVKSKIFTVCLEKGPSSEFLDLERSRGEEVVVGCLLENASTAPGILYRVVSFPTRMVNKKRVEIRVRNGCVWF